MKTIAEELSDLKTTIANFFQGGSKAEVEVTRLSGLLEASQKEAGKVAGLEASIVEKDKDLAKLKGELNVAIEAKDKADKDASETKANVDKIAHQKAANIEQGRGVTQPVQDKGTQTDAPAGTDATPKTKAEEYRELIAKGDNRGAAAFYAKNKEEIFSGK